jgi:hypothetical protein
MVTPHKKHTANGAQQRDVPHATHPMLSSDDDNRITTKIDVVRSAWARIRAHLENQRARINDQIGRYPTPIAGCDQQFNYLLEQRTGLSAEGRRLNRAENLSLSAEDPVKVLDDFISASRTIEQGVGNAIRRFLAEALSIVQD